MKKAKEEKEIKTKNNVKGIPMSEESKKDWENSFIQMEECFNYLDKQQKKKK